MQLFEWMKLRGVYLEANEGATGGGGGTDPATAKPDADPTAGEVKPDAPAPVKPDAGTTVKPDESKKYTQAELQAEIDRVAAKTRADEKRKYEEELRRAEMTKLERAEVEKAEADERLTSTQQELAWVKTESEIRVQALAAGIKPEVLTHFIKLVDLDGIKINSEGQVDAEAVKSAVNKIIEDIPAFKSATASVPKAGGDFGGGGDGPKDLKSQILEAETKGDWALAGQLKAVQMSNLHNPT